MSASALVNSTRSPGRLVNYFLYEFWDEQSAPEVKGEYKTPVHLLASVAVYLLLVLYVLPKHMANRKPYSLKTAMKLYNIINIVGNGVLCVGGFYFFNWGRDCWMCTRGTVHPWVIRKGGELFIALKVFDFLDTIFFILRKKTNQVTLLHLVHHSIMPITAYVGLKMDATPTAGFTLMINSFVHVVMYYYYHLASTGPVWWKKYITVIQIIQFYLVLVHSLHTFFVPDCHYHKVLAFLQVIESTYFIITFSSFYRATYMKKKKSLDTNIDVNNNTNNKKLE